MFSLNKKGVPVEQLPADPLNGHGVRTAGNETPQTDLGSDDWKHTPHTYTDEPMQSELQMQPWVRAVGRFMSQITYGTLRVDLARPAWRVNYRPRGRNREDRNYRGDPVHPRAGAMSHLHHEDLYQSQGIVHGARVKAMRCFGAGPVVPVSPSGRRVFDAGVGVSLDLAGSGLTPVARLRLVDVVRLHLAPYPVFKLKHSFPLWRSGLCLHAAFVQSLNSRTFANLGKRGTWRLAIGRMGDNEFIVAPDRVELSNARLFLGPNICLHVSGELNYPRIAPDPDWQDQCSFLPSRVCVKVGW